MIEITKNVKSGFEHHDEIMKKILKITGSRLPLELISVHGDLQSVKIDDIGLSSSKKTALKAYIESL